MEGNSENNGNGEFAGDAEGDNSVTMVDVLKGQEAFEEHANAVLGGSDDKECTYSSGYVKRQALYACLTCCADARTDSSQWAGICLACSLTCHENHNLVELYTKRNFRCDCGGPKFPNHPCSLNKEIKSLNNDNVYDQNFGGLYCICHRPYPDTESTEDDEMIQCIICEDWLHSKHLNAVVPSNDDYSEMICENCMDKKEFLYDYTTYAVESQDVSIDLEISDVGLDQSIDDTKNTINGDDTKKDQVESNYVETDNRNGDISTPLTDESEHPNDSEDSKLNEDCKPSKHNSESTESEKPIPDSVSTEKEGDEKITEHQEDIKNLAEISEPTGDLMDVDANDITDKTDSVADQDNEHQSIDAERSKEDEFKLSLESNDSEKPEECPDNKGESEKNLTDEKDNLNIQLDLEINKDNDSVTKDKEEIETDGIEKLQDDIQSSNDIQAESDGNKELINERTSEEKADEEIKSKNDNKDDEAVKTCEDDVGTTTKLTDPIDSSDTVEKKIDHDEEDAVDTSDAQSQEPLLLKDVSDFTGDAEQEKPKENFQSTENDLTPDCKNVESEKTDDKELQSNMELDDEPNENTTDDLKKNDEPKEVSNNGIDKESTTDCAEKMESENLNDENNDEKENLTASGTEFEKTNAESCSFKEKNSISDDNNENNKKRKFVSDDSLDILSSNKKSKLEKGEVVSSKCKRPENPKKRKGAAFWPCNWRKKLCSCTSCLTMYKDLNVLFLLDDEDTVSAYEDLGKSKCHSSYEKGLKALSTFDRIQQINALTEYNKMKDKLLDYLKCFKEKKEVVKEEDIKKFFAGMKPKRESDGVYFCR